jgi:hypothetical protein
MRYVVPLLFVLLTPVALAAQSVPWKHVVPTAATASEGITSTALPFGSTVARRVLYAYDGSSVGHMAPVRIRAISLRCDGATPGGSLAGSYDFRLDLSTCRNAIGALATDFSQNHGADRLRVHDGILAVPAPSVGAAPNVFSLRIPCATPFDWDPRNGPLVLDFGYGSGSPAFAAWDAQSVGVAGLSANGATAVSATSVLVAAPVLRLEVESNVVTSSGAVAEASSSTGYPWNRPAGTGMRVLNVYDGAIVPFTGRRRITGLAWRTDAGLAFPGCDYTVRLSMSTSDTTLATLDPTFAANHGPDLTVVFDGVLQAPPTPASTDLGHFDLFCELQRSFEYDPAVGSLVIEMQLFDSTGTGVPFDTPFHTNTGVGRVHDSSSATVATGTTQAGVALITALRTVPVPTVPAALANDVNANGGNATAYPFSLSSCRTVLLLSAAEAGITEPFVVRHLRFRPAASELSRGPSTYTMTIDLSHAATTPATASSTFDSNHGPDRERVFDGPFSVPFFTRTADDPAFRIEVKLQQPFLWSPTIAPYLAIDLRTLSRDGDAILIETTNGLTHDDARVLSTAPSASVGSVQQLAPVVQLGGEGPNATATNYGLGCIGTNGRPTTGTIGLPELPNPDFRITIHNALGNAAALFGAGFTPIQVTLPGTLDCDLLHLSEVGILGWTITDPLGYGTVPLPLANDISMHDLEFQTQWIVLDPTANALGLVTSDAQAMVAKFF